MFGGVQIIETITAATPVEDWSRVRSPSRAARRLKSGKRKHPVPIWLKPACFQIGGAFYMHPELMRELRRRTPAGGE